VYPKRRKKKKEVHFKRGGKSESQLRGRDNSSYLWGIEGTPKKKLKHLRKCNHERVGEQGKTLTSGTEIEKRNIGAQNGKGEVCREPLRAFYGTSKDLKVSELQSSSAQCRCFSQGRELNQRIAARERACITKREIGMNGGPSVGTLNKGEQTKSGLGISRRKLSKLLKHISGIALKFSILRKEKEWSVFWADLTPRNVGKVRLEFLISLLVSGERRREHEKFY